MKNLVINALGRTRRWSVIKSLAWAISSESKADMTAAYQQAAEWEHLWYSTGKEWKNGGICGIAQEKEKHCSSEERTIQITSCCASSWPRISLRWKFGKKKKKVQTIRSNFWNNLSIAGTVGKLELFSRWGYSHVYKVLREMLACLLSSS